MSKEVDALVLLGSAHEICQSVRENPLEASAVYTAITALREDADRFMDLNVDLASLMSGDLLVNLGSLARRHFGGEDITKSYELNPFAGAVFDSFQRAFPEPVDDLVIDIVASAEGHSSNPAAWINANYEANPNLSDEYHAKKARAAGIIAARGKVEFAKGRPADIERIKVLAENITGIPVPDLPLLAEDYVEILPSPAPTVCRVPYYSSFMFEKSQEMLGAALEDLEAIGEAIRV